MADERPESLSTMEFFLIKSAAKLLGAVRWLEEHPPPPEKMDWLNSKVKAEIVRMVTINDAHSIYGIYRCLFAPSLQRMLKLKEYAHRVSILSSN